MIDKKNLINIQKLLNNKKIVYSKLLSNSFGINCFKITTDDKKNYVVKYYNTKKNKFNAIASESKNIEFLNNLNLNFFPKLYSKNDDYLILSFLKNDELKPNEAKNDFINAIVSIHSFNNDNYGFEFNTQIGGLEQKNSFKRNWVEFYRDYRLSYIYDLINSSQPMNDEINKKIELLLKKLDEFIPKNPRASLLHGDLWEGNILFYKKMFIGLIDPGTFYGHNELEIAYLTWFNPMFIRNGFINKYNDIIKIDKEYKNYESVYQLYYSLLNVHLWDRNYIKNVKRLLDKIKI